MAAQYMNQPMKSRFFIVSTYINYTFTSAKSTLSFKRFVFRATARAVMIYFVQTMWTYFNYALSFTMRTRVKILFVKIF